MLELLNIVLLFYFPEIVDIQLFIMKKSFESIESLKIKPGLIRIVKSNGIYKMKGKFTVKSCQRGTKKGKKIEKKTYLSHEG